MKAPSRSRYYSQFREDRLLELVFGGKRTGNCVEVGAHDGITGSNTYHFEEIGWKCVLVEPVPGMCERMRRFRTGTIVNCAASSAPGKAVFHVSDPVESLSALHLTESQKGRISSAQASVREIQVTKRTLDDILSEAGVEEPDFVSIDVEGHELEVLKGFSLDRFRPRILIVEDNLDTTGASVREHLERSGYRNFLRTGVNDWYGRETDPVTGSESVEKLKKRLKRYEFEDRIRRRFAFLDNRLPAPLNKLLSRVLGHVAP